MAARMVEELALLAEVSATKRASSSATRLHEAAAISRSEPRPTPRAAAGKRSAQDDSEGQAKACPFFLFTGALLKLRYT